MKPITPTVLATKADINTATPIDSSRVRSTETPRLRATSSPASSTDNGRISNARGRLHTARRVARWMLGPQLCWLSEPLPHMNRPTRYRSFTSTSIVAAAPQ